MNLPASLKAPEGLNAALEALNAVSLAAGAPLWQLTLPGASHRAAQLALRENWAQLRLPHPTLLARPAQAAELWPLLVDHSRRHVIAKPILTTGQQVILRADVPLAPELDLAEWVDRCSAQFEVALDPRQTGPRLPPDAQPDNSTAPGPTDVRRLCAEAGWNGTERDQGFSVPLEGNDHQPHAALLTATTALGSALRAQVELERFDAPARDCQAALGLFLLLVNRRLRWARAELDEGNGSTVVRLVVELPAPVTPRALHHALSALSVGVRLSGAEVAALGHSEELAQEYLRLRGWSWEPAETNANPSTP
ncbi:MAG: hypothetical protein FJ387_21450 [Verrucomicrobia bacterium]|nr:hypothetical protein [Verrucomicrobiota bacterium]